jgi:tetratricopeptide (TPR) repeat protein
VQYVRQISMPDTPRQEIKLFYCYARKDKSLRDELEKHLSGLKRHYQLTNWHDREILPGKEWEQAIDTHLNTAHLILLLISPDFMASDYCFSKEMQRALARHKAGTCRVVPILLRPAFWEEAPFSTIQLLPTDANPITTWDNRDLAFQDVAKEISQTIKDLLISLKTQKEEWLKKGADLRHLKHYEEALAAYEQAIRLDPNYARAYNNKGDILYDLKRYEEALATYEQAIRLDPNYARAYNNKGVVFRHLKRYEEALATYEQAIRLDPNDANAYYRKGHVLERLKRYEKALAAFEQAIHLDPNNANAYYYKGLVLERLKRYKEAEQAFSKAHQLEQRS